MARVLLNRAAQLAILLILISTVLFFVLRLTGDPAVVLAGSDPTPDAVARISAHYGLDRPLPAQYATFVGNVLTGDLGTSLATGQPALDLVFARITPTLSLAATAITVDAVLAVVVGTWLGARTGSIGRRVVSSGVFVAQAVPAYVVGLLLIQVFAVDLRWLPSIGAAGPGSWVLPSLTLAAFLAPQLIRIVATNVAEAMREDYVRTALATGAGGAALLVRHVLPNALLATVAVIGTQFAYLISGALLTEVIFGWPGLGRLLVEAVTRLDFPVVQATVVVVAVGVFVVNTGLDLVFRMLDPRLRSAS
ncbi:ABC transporter permease [Actinophytocola sp.]|uniref:ABC transporter permease n=1 Tax=Actinophytocola sp. TaxID=1872138 RepID=UPI0038998A28